MVFTRLHNFAAVIFLTLLMLQGPAPGGDAPGDAALLFDFSEGIGAWRLSPPQPNAARGVKHSKNALEVELEFPGAASADVILLNAAKQRGADWTDGERLTLRIKLPGDAPDDVQAIAFLKDGTLSYYQALRKVPLTPGEWNEIPFDLRPFNLDWEAIGHFKPWDGYVLQEIMQFGIKLQSMKPFKGSALIGPMRMDKAPPPESPEPTKIENLRTNAGSIGRYEKFELSFNLNRCYENPFDPAQVDVQGVFIAPSGKTCSAPGFFYQNYIREKIQLEERLTPIGRPHWKIRFAPVEIGRYRYYIKVKDSSESRTGMLEFECVESANRGFVRIEPEKKRNFEFSDSSNYYPIGHNIAADSDARGASGLGFVPTWGEGTFAYDRYLGRMAGAEENFCRLWFSYWSLGLEWTRQVTLEAPAAAKDSPSTYDPSQYGNLGRYHLKHAWKLDHILETAARNNIYMLMLFTAHGEISADYESQWKDSPYFSGNGGPLDAPNTWYTDPQVNMYYKRRLRYIAARWGYSTNVLGWDLLNEPDLANYYRAVPNEAAAWVKDMILYMKTQDPNPHLYTSGLFRYRERWAEPVMGLPEVDFNTAHVFEANLADQLLADVTELTQKYDKIFLVTEADLTPFQQNPILARRALHMALWCSYCMPYAGAAMSWWWVFIDQHDLYCHFHALAKFARGEDRRKMDLAVVSPVVESAPEAAKRALRCQCVQGSGRAYLWVYDSLAFASAGCWKKFEALPAMVRLENLPPGRYHVEIWDTIKGEAISASEIETPDGKLLIELPPFETDIACKVRQVEAGEQKPPAGEQK
ncbi:MAG TPA: DUF5060 domain-containing protein [Candidatus Brocadiia bacterium]|nr:DUF5060 domain-containing protein [Candidatus Brocadiia bacterium]